MKFTEQEARLFGCQFIKLTSGFDKKEARMMYRDLGYKEGSSFRKNL